MAKRKGEYRVYAKGLPAPVGRTKTLKRARKLGKKYVTKGSRVITKAK